MGIGSGINEDTLRQIAGEKGDVIIVEDFDKLTLQLVEIEQKICGRSSIHKTFP